MLVCHLLNTCRLAYYWIMHKQHSMCDVIQLVQNTVIRCAQNLCVRWIFFWSRNNLPSCLLQNTNNIHVLTNSQIDYKKDLKHSTNPIWKSLSYSTRGYNLFCAFFKLLFLSRHISFDPVEKSVEEYNMNLEICSKCDIKDHLFIIRRKWFILHSVYDTYVCIYLSEKSIFLPRTPPPPTIDWCWIYRFQTQILISRIWSFIMISYTVSLILKKTFRKTFWNKIINVYGLWA